MAELNPYLKRLETLEELNQAAKSESEKSTAAILRRLAMAESRIGAVDDRTASAFADVATNSQQESALRKQLQESVATLEAQGKDNDDQGTNTQIALIAEEIKKLQTEVHSVEVDVNAQQGLLDTFGEVILTAERTNAAATNDFDESLKELQRTLSRLELRMGALTQRVDNAEQSSTDISRTLETVLEEEKEDLLDLHEAVEEIRAHVDENATELDDLKADTRWQRGDLLELYDVEDATELPPDVVKRMNEADVDGDGSVTVKELLEDRARRSRKKKRA